MASVALFNSLNIIESSGDESNHQFIGPCYSQGNAKLILNKIKEIIAAGRLVQNIYWLAPDDAFWGKSLRFNTFVGALGQFKNKQNVELKLKCFLPMNNEQDKASIINYRKIIAKDHQKYFYGIKEGLLAGNFEMLVVENEFAVVILHVLASEAEYLTSFPIGSMSTNKSMVNSLVNLFDAWQRPKEKNGISFGPMFKK